MLRLSDEALDRALAHIRHQGDTDIFPLAFEFEAISGQWSEVQPRLRAVNLLDWAVGASRTCLVPKHRYGFRPSTQLDPMDSLLFTGLVYELGEDLEAARAPATDDVAFAVRFGPQTSGSLFDPAYSFSRFQDVTREIIRADEPAYVVLADIADFFPRLYLHRLENACDAATQKQHHVSALLRMLKQWNANTSYGIPVGPAVSRLLAEVALDDVDRDLLSEGYRHVRYIDDFRIFCADLTDAYRALTTLAQILFTNHGLTLQQHKTRIVEAERFVSEELESEEEREFRELHESLDSLVEELLGVSDPYFFVMPENIPDELREHAITLNLERLLLREIGQEEIDTRLTTFLLKRITRMSATNVLNTVLARGDALYPVFAEVVRCISACRFQEQEEERAIAERLVSLVEESALGQLPYHQMWVFHLFASRPGAPSPRTIRRLMSRFPDPVAQRELVLALGARREDSYFRQQKARWMNWAPWARRAVLAGAGCLPRDEREHWHRSIRQRCTDLEEFVLDWSAA